MQECVLTNVREKLSTARDLCKGLKEEVYVFADYMAIIVQNDTIEPEVLADTLYHAKQDITFRTYHFKHQEPLKFLRYLESHAVKIARCSIFIPIIIDEVASTEFAEAFREAYLKRMLNPAPVIIKKYYLLEPIEGAKYSDNVLAAVNWWANIITKPQHDDTFTYESDTEKDILQVTYIISRFTKEQLDIFRRRLAIEIYKLQAWMSGECYIESIYGADDYLCKAAKEAGIQLELTFPTDIKMFINNFEVKVKEVKKVTAIWEKE